ncbi:MAG: SlyX family protein [Bacteriovorax sp.]|jgi:SlyX protein
MLEERIKDLEIKFSHQDEFILELNKIVTAQQLLVEKLQKEVLELKLSQSENASAAGRTLADDVPPHY